MKADPRDLNWQKVNQEIRLAPLGESLSQRDQLLGKIIKAIIH